MRLLQPALLPLPRAAAVSDETLQGQGTLTTLTMPAEIADVLRLACEWRRMQAYGSHEELRAKLSQLGQACDRYERLRS